MSNTCAEHTARALLHFKSVLRKWKAKDINIKYLLPVFIVCYRI